MLMHEKTCVIPIIKTENIVLFSGEKKTKLVRTEDGRFRRMAVFDDESEDEDSGDDSDDDDDDSNGVGPSYLFHNNALRPNKKIPVFRVTGPYLNLLVKPRSFFRFS